MIRQSRYVNWGVDRLDSLLFGKDEGGEAQASGPAQSSNAAWQGRTCICEGVCHLVSPCCCLRGFRASRAILT